MIAGGKFQPEQGSVPFPGDRRWGNHIVTSGVSRTHNSQLKVNDELFPGAYGNIGVNCGVHGGDPS